MKTEGKNEPGKNPELVASASTYRAGVPNLSGPGPPFFNCAPLLPRAGLPEEPTTSSAPECSSLGLLLALIHPTSGGAGSACITSSALLKRSVSAFLI